MRFARISCAIGLWMLVSGCSKDAAIEPTATLTIASTFTNEEYDLAVYLPADFDPSEHHPVLYLLDGHYHVNDVQALIASQNYLSNVVLVSISYHGLPFAVSNLSAIEAKREVDLTFPEHITDGGEQLGGGGLLFRSFLKEEAFPLVESTYAVSPDHRTLLGHSLEGYFALNEVFGFSDDPLFEHVVPLSPSLWWSQLEIFELEAHAADVEATLPFDLYMGIGAFEGVEANALVEELAIRLSEHDHSGLNHLVQRYEGGHLHSAASGFENALKYLFE